jgi:hypothetical protein
MLGETTLGEMTLGKTTLGEPTSYRENLPNLVTPPGTNVIILEIFSPK